MNASQIQKEVAATHGITHECMMRPSNEAKVVAARNEAMARCRIELGMSFPQIGHLFGKHHTTVIYGVRNYMEAHSPDITPPRPERLESALVRQARFIRKQAVLIEALTAELVQLRTSAQSGSQGESSATADEVREVLQ